MTKRNILVVSRGGHTFSFIYDDDPASVTELIRTFGRFAADPELSFAWHDALILMDRIPSELKVAADELLQRG